jgi:ribosomal protein S18 acetylase RimI-like enzyme
MIRLRATRDPKHAAVHAHQEQYLDKLDLTRYTSYEILLDASCGSSIPMGCPVEQSHMEQSPVKQSPGVAVKCIGCAAIDTTGDVAVLVYLAIDSDCQGHGYGRQSLTALLALYPTMMIRVNPNNAPAVALYASAGYMLQNERDVNGEVLAVKK